MEDRDGILAGVILLFVSVEQVNVEWKKYLFVQNQLSFPSPKYEPWETCSNTVVSSPGQVEETSDGYVPSAQHMPVLGDQGLQRRTAIRLLIV